MDNNNNISFEDLTGTSPRPQAPQKQTNGFAIASMVLGIISVLCCCIGYISIILGILAIVFFAIDRKTNGKSKVGKKTKTKFYTYATRNPVAKRNFTKKNTIHYRNCRTMRSNSNISCK